VTVPDPPTPEFEKPGHFYLGREYDLAARSVLPTPLLLKSENLTTHAVCVGMTGSGKTGLCLSLLEEAALSGIPAIAIDPKGDLGNLLLAFPELAASDFRPWIDPSEAGRRGLAPEALAEETAERWRRGLADWGQDGARIRRFVDAVDRTIYTPGSTAGMPLTILKSFAAPPAAIVEDGDAMRDRVEGAASGLLGLLGVDADPVNSREHILLANIFDRAWRSGRGLDLSGLIQEIQRPPFKQVGVVDLESFFPAAERLQFGMRLNNLLASPSFAGWLEGESLDVGRLLYADDGKPRLSILSIAHLTETERMFFVTMLLSEVVAWTRSQPGTSNLRAILYMDEVFGYFPPVANPPSKRPMLTLLKQARAYGLGCVLATQNPVDLDYKGLSNAGVWFLGRLQTERDKRRVIEGLEGASTEAGAQFDRREMEATLAALDSRVFLMNNVHADRPAVFHSRWAMSYLRGPLTRSQIGALMAERKQAAAREPARVAPAPASAPAAAAARPAGDVEPASDGAPAGRRPVISAEIPERFWPVDPHEPAAAGRRLTYRPALLGVGRAHYVKAGDDVDVWHEFVALQPVHGELPKPPWQSSMFYQAMPTLAADPIAEAAFDALPSELAVAKNYHRWDDDLKSHVYQHERLALWRSAEFELLSRPGESEAEFRIRALPALVAKLEAEVAEASLQSAEHRFWFLAFLAKAFARTIEILLSGVVGRKSRKKVVTQSVWGEAMRDRQRYAEARRRLREKEAALARLQPGPGAGGDAAAAAPADVLPLERVDVAPRKSDIAVDQVMLVWLPWWIGTGGEPTPAY
jgi:hypothetical protein